MPILVDTGSANLGMFNLIGLFRFVFSSLFSLFLSVFLLSLLDQFSLITVRREVCCGSSSFIHNYDGILKKEND